MNRVRSRGLTLLELMITIAIIGILAAIAYPSYISQVRKSHRSDAKSNLLTLSQKMERLMSEQGSYEPATTTPGFYPSVTDGGYYALSLAATATTFTVTATPLGDQLNDSCGTYTYDDKGVKGSSGDTPANCW